MEIYNTTIGNSWQTGRSMQATVLYAGGKQYTGFGREPWSSGYGRQLIFKRSWVGITAPFDIFHSDLLQKLFVRKDQK